MKSIYLVIFCVCFIKLVSGQNTVGFNYQTVARSTNGNVIANSNIQMKISILQGETSGTPVSVEEFNVTTNAYGLINVIVGSKSSVIFEQIDWSKGPYFLKVEMDENGGTNYSFIGTSQLLSVPYALHSKTAQYTQENDPVFSVWDKSIGITISEKQINDLTHFTNADENDPVFSNSIAATIKSEDITNWNSIRTETDPIFNSSIAKNISANDIMKWNNKSDFDGKYTSLSNIPAFHSVAFSGNYYDLTNIPPNIISLSKAPIKGDILYYNGNQWITLPIGSSGQVLSIDLSGLPIWK